jgi:outer membrane protein insertion porin family
MNTSIIPPADRNNEDNTQWRKDNFGTTRSIVLEHVTDTRDNVYYPTMGGRIGLTGEVAGFGGDFHFQKVDISDQRYFKAGKSQVWATRLQYGWSHGHLSWFNQYKLGGQDTLRGYRDDQFRGNHMALLTLEYRFPIMSKVQGALFTDWGSAWDSGLWPDSLNGSIGVGVFITTPLGPLRLDYGHGKNGNRLHFNVGSSF